MTTPAKTNMKPMQFFVPISRMDPTNRTIEGYGFVNEVVEGEGGVRLKRKAMEEATPDYMKWANVREMHGSKAVGVTESVTWDDKGALMRMTIADDDAWAKCQAGVYKGLSVGVRGNVMRGRNVERCTWLETSLVDRPADPDAKMTVCRSADIKTDEDMQKTYPVELLPSKKEEKKLARQASAELKRKSKTDTSKTDKTEDGGDKMDKTIMQRVDTLTAENTELKKLNSEIKLDFSKVLQRVEGLDKSLRKAKEEIKRFGQAKAPGQEVVRFPEALQRSFGANEMIVGEDAELKECAEEYKRVCDQAAKTDDQQVKIGLIARSMELNSILQAHGVIV